MKKIIFMILIIAMAFSMTSCNKNEPEFGTDGIIQSKTMSELTNWNKIVSANELKIGITSSDKSFCNDLIEEFEKELNIPVSTVVLNDNLKEELSKGTIDMYWGLYPKEATDSFDYTLSSPYLTSTAALITVKGKEPVSSVGVLKNSAEEKLVQGKYETIKTYSSLNELWTALGYGKTDAVLINICDWEKSPYATSETYEVKNTTMYNLVVIFKNGYADVAHEIDATLAKIKASGAASKISEKWYGKDLISK